MCIPPDKFFIAPNAIRRQSVCGGSIQHYQRCVFKPKRGFQYSFLFPFPENMWCYVSTILKHGNNNASLECRTIVSSIPLNFVFIH